MRVDTIACLDCLPGEDVSHAAIRRVPTSAVRRSEEHTSELQSQSNLVCRLLLEKKKRLTIEHAGSSVTEAAAASEAIREVGRVPHRGVLTDLRLTNSAGIAFLRAATTACSAVRV